MMKYPVKKRTSLYRLIVTIRYDKGRVFVRYVLTHAEYDRGDWKK